MSPSIALRKATPKQVRYACMNYHYAKAVPLAQVAFACYEDNKFVGVILYSSGASPFAAIQFGNIQGEALELVRVALNQDAHKAPTSQYVSRSIKLLKKIKPFCKIVFSYADYTMQGHTGIIYQASNFMCLGKRTMKKGSAYLVDGKHTHWRTIVGKYGSIEEARKHHQIEDVTNLTKILYVWCYDQTLRRELESKAVSFHEIEGGAVPTSPL